jgi:FtsH-binding integral membrane protein
MQDYTNRNNNGSINLNAAATYDQGLRNHMIKVFNHMAVGLGITGLVSLAALSVPAISALIFNQAAQIMLFVAMLGMVFFVMPKMFTMSESGAKTAFYAYAVILALSIAPIFLAYTSESIARVFFITSAVFLSMSIFGYSTKKDLTSVGTFAIIGVWGVFFASIVNIFIGSSTISFITSIVAVVASVGLTAYDVQKIKQVYYAVGRDQSTLNKAAIMGALQLYFDFVYMFINLLRLLGDRR